MELSGEILLLDLLKIEEFFGVFTLLELVTECLFFNFIGLSSPSAALPFVGLESSNCMADLRTESLAKGNKAFVADTLILLNFLRSLLKEN